MIVEKKKFPEGDNLIVMIMAFQRGQVVMMMTVILMAKNKE